MKDGSSNAIGRREREEEEEDDDDDPARQSERDSTEGEQKTEDNDEIDATRNV